MHSIRSMRAATFRFPIRFTESRCIRFAESQSDAENEPPAASTGVNANISGVTSNVRAGFNAATAATNADASAPASPEAPATENTPSSSETSDANPQPPPAESQPPATQPETPSASPAAENPPSAPVRVETDSTGRIIEKSVGGSVAATALPAAVAVGTGPLWLMGGGAAAGFGLHRLAKAYEGTNAGKYLGYAGNASYVASAASIPWSIATAGYPQGVAAAAVVAGGLGVGYGVNRLSNWVNKQSWMWGDEVNPLGKGFFGRAFASPVAAAAVPVGLWKTASQKTWEIASGHTPKSWWGKLITGTLGVPLAPVGFLGKRVVHDVLWQKVIKGGASKVKGLWDHLMSPIGS